MASLVDILEARDDTYLSWAKSQDVELYRAADKAGTLRQGSNKPKTFEWGITEQILSGIFLLLQQDIHVNARSRKRFSGRPWPHPETAADIVKRERADQGHHDLMAEIVFVSQDEFEAHIAAHAESTAVVRHQPGA